MTTIAPLPAMYRIFNTDTIHWSCMSHYRESLGTKSSFTLECISPSGSYHVCIHTFALSGAKLPYQCPIESKENRLPCQCRMGTLCSERAERAQLRNATVAQKLESRLSGPGEEALRRMSHGFPLPLLLKVESV
jgi:hypothetical protein